MESSQNFLKYYKGCTFRGERIKSLLPPLCLIVFGTGLDRVSLTPKPLKVTDFKAGVVCCCLWFVMFRVMALVGLVFVRVFLLGLVFG